MGSQQMEQIPASSQFGNNEQFIIHAKDIKQSNDIVMSAQFSQHVDLLLQFGNVLGIIPQHDAFAGEFFAFPGPGCGMMSLGLAAAGYTDLSVGSFSDDQVPMEEVAWTTLGGIECGLGRVIVCGRVVVDVLLIGEWMGGTTVSVLGWGRDIVGHTDTSGIVELMGSSCSCSLRNWIVRKRT